MKNSLLRSFILVLCCLWASSNASARTYLVEMVSFTNEGVTAERWDHQSEQAQIRRNKVNAIFAGAKQRGGRTDLSYLRKIYSALAGSSEHRILKVNRWTQRSGSYGRSPLVRVDNDDLSIKGGVRVYAPNLLFAELNLMYAPNGDSLAVSPQGANEAYFITERRRMKLKEVHYFDHAKFGVILIVVPI